MKDKTWNDHISEMIKVVPLGDKMIENHLRLFGHINVDHLVHSLGRVIVLINIECRQTYYYY